MKTIKENWVQLYVAELGDTVRFYLGDHGFIQITHSDHGLEVHEDNGGGPIQLTIDPKLVNVSALR